MKNKSFEITGGARIGNYQGSWPFGKLKVTSDRLEISVSFKKAVFAPEDIVVVEPFRKLVLQEGYDEESIRRIGWFTTVLSSIMLFAFLSAS